MNIYSPAQIHSYLSTRCTFTEAHTPLISPHLPPGHRDLHRQLIFPAHISHQPDKTSDATSFSEATPHPSASLSCFRSSFFRGGMRSVAGGWSNRGLLDPDGRRLGRSGCLAASPTGLLGIMSADECTLTHSTVFISLTRLSFISFRVLQLIF